MSGALTRMGSELSSLFEEETTMTIQSQDLTIIPRDYDIFSGLDVDKHSITATFCNHGELMQSLRLPYSSDLLLNYVRSIFRISEWRLFTKLGQPPNPAI